MQYRTWMMHMVFEGKVMLSRRLSVRKRLSWIWVQKSRIKSSSKENCHNAKTSCLAEVNKKQFIMLSCDLEDYHVRGPRLEVTLFDDSLIHTKYMHCVKVSGEIPKRCFVQYNGGRELCICIYKIYMHNSREKQHACMYTSTSCTQRRSCARGKFDNESTVHKSCVGWNELEIFNKRSWYTLIWNNDIIWVFPKIVVPPNHPF